MKWLVKMFLCIYAPVLGRQRRFRKVWMSNDILVEYKNIIVCKSIIVHGSPHDERIRNLLEKWRHVIRY